MAMEFITYEQVRVDGVAAGWVGDVARNYPTRGSELLVAYRTFRASKTEIDATEKQSALDAQKAQSDASQKVTSDAFIAEIATLKANHAQIVLNKNTEFDATKADHNRIIVAKDADFDAAKIELIDVKLVRNELQSLAATSVGIIADRDAEIILLKAAFNPPIPTPITGATKTVAITVDATAWDGILASIYDPSIDIPAETQATNFILNQYAAKFVAWAEKENYKPVEAQAEQAKKQIKDATQARAKEVLSSTQVTIT